jgi:L-ascorbate metabolism protein UlaG (beta-lactamase superfamily)
VILIDPYRPQALGGRITHGPITLTPDVVVVTHFHEDHGWIGGIAGRPVIVDRDATAAGIEFRCVWVPHDPHGGCQMGMSRMFAFTVDGVAFWHPGDVGRLPTEAEQRVLGPVDCLLLPVGGRFTIEIPEALTLMERLKPIWTIPMHYRSARVDLDIHERQTFLDAMPADRPQVSVAGSDWTPDVDPGVVLLEPAL